MNNTKTKYSLKKMKAIFNKNKAFLDAEFNSSSFENNAEKNVSLLEIALVITDSDYNILETYHKMVKPDGKKAIVSGYIKSLTGIKQGEVDKAKTTYSDVVRDINFLCNKWEITNIFCYGSNDIVSLAWNTKDTALDIPETETIENKLIDVEYGFREYLKSILPDVDEKIPSISLKFYIKAIKGEKSGNSHRALNDAHDLLLVYKTIMNKENIDNNFIEILSKYTLFRGRFNAMQKYINNQKKELRDDLQMKLYGCLFDEEPITEELITYLKNHPQKSFKYQDFIRMIKYYTFLKTKDLNFKSKLDKNLEKGIKIARAETYMKGLG